MAKLLSTMLLLTLGMVLPFSSASAASITVTTTADEYGTGGACSLREAAEAANNDSAFGGCPAGSGNDTIVLGTGTYELSIVGTDENLNVDGDIDLFDEDGVTVQGNARDLTFVDGNGGTTLERVFDIRAGSATFLNLTVRDGDGREFGQRGGGIFGHSNQLLTINNSRIASNIAGYRGGGVAAGGVTDLTILSSEIANNEAIDGDEVDPDGDGGGIYIDGGTLVVQDSRVVNNHADDMGGGIKAWGESATITHSVISGNSVAEGDGGGLWLEPTGPILAPRTAGGGPPPFGYSIIDSTIAGNSTASGASGMGDGGGLWVGCCGLLEISGSTFHDNTARNGGGISTENEFSEETEATLIENSTVSSNYANVDGGGIFNDGGATTLNHVTVYRNQVGLIVTGGGIFEIGGEIQYRNSIIAGNQHDNCGGSGTSLGHNVLGDGSCDDSGTGDIAPDMGPDIDVRLGTLEDNGGPTHTHELLPGSPAIDTAEGGATCPATDQRGLARPTGAQCDIGAYEVGDVDVLGGELFRLRCRRLDPTIIGTSGNDNIKGTPGRDVIQGLEGRDVLRGVGGNDVICGARGNDILKGGKGDDILKGHRGIDTYRGGGGKDLCIPGPEDDIYKGCEAPPQTTK
jgi:CSLREA domain-containing protein